jgi:hypothetical protein
MFVRKTNLYQDSILGNASDAVSGMLYTKLEVMLPNTLV